VKLYIKRALNFSFWAKADPEYNRKKARNKKIIRFICFRIGLVNNKKSKLRLKLMFFFKDVKKITPPYDILLIFLDKSAIVYDEQKADKGDEYQK